MICENMISFVILLTFCGASFSLPFENTPFYEFVTPNTRISNGIGGRIVGGQEAPAHAFPYQVGFYSNFPSKTDFCGGSLVSSRYVLTAAHCVSTNGEIATSVDLIFGAQNILTDEWSQQKQSSSQFVIHPGWNPSTLLNDIALIKLSKAVVENQYIRIITIASGSNAYIGYPGLITGWGITSDSGTSVTAVLRYAISNILSNAQCKNSSASYNNVIQPTHLCLNGATGQGTCSGDSGGPLVADGVQVGVVSFGYKYCEARYPSVFTRLTNYISWIRANSDVNI